MVQIATILWAESRLEIAELVKVKEQFTAKYGKGEVEASVSNSNSLVSPAVITALMPPVLTDEEVTAKVSEVTSERGIQYHPSSTYTEVLSNQTQKQEDELEAELEQEERKQPVRNTLPADVLKYIAKRMKKDEPDVQTELRDRLEELVAPKEPVDELEALRQRFNKLK